jgi:hypothetical protein
MVLTSGDVLLCPVDALTAFERDGNSWDERFSCAVYEQNNTWEVYLQLVEEAEEEPEANLRHRLTPKSRADLWRFQELEKQKWNVGNAPIKWLLGC